MNPGVRWKLCVMMFLEFFVWGAWLATSFSFFADGMGFDGWQQFGLNTAFPASAIIAMFFANQFVDRNFAAQRFLAFSHFVGGLAILGFGVLAWLTFHENGASLPSFMKDSPPTKYWVFFSLMAIHCLFYVPTISVTNTIAFANVKDAQKEFGGIRLWGTIGWIAASWPFIFILADWARIKSMDEVGFVTWLGEALGTPLKGNELNQGISWTFITAGIASLVLSAFSLTLPHVPPKPAHDEESKLAWLEAIRLLKKPFLFVLFVVTFIDATVHDGFFFFAFDYLKKVGVPANWVTPAMSIGQVAEIGTMAFLGVVLKRLGWRWTMIIGILGHTARFAVFALLPNPTFAVAVNVLHGICYAFFFATLYILVDEVFPKDARTSAQGLFNFLILGLGPITARFVWPRAQAAFTTGSEVDYGKVLLIPSGAALVGAILLLLFFHPPAPSKESS